MALFTPSESPAVVVREIDLTGGVPNVQSTTGAYAGNFNWGPVLERVNIANEEELVSNFGAPTIGTSSDVNDATISVDFLSATQFLRYSGSLVAVRNINDSSTKSAFSMETGDSVSVDSSASLYIDNPLVLNKDNFDARKSTLAGLVDSYTPAADSSPGLGIGYGFIARYPGALGNSLEVQYLPASDSTTTTATKFTAWTFSNQFDAAPGSSNFAVGKGSSNDEMHVIVIDRDGNLTGSRGTVLERFQGVSSLRDAKSDEGVSIFVKDVVNEQSEYVFLSNLDSDLEVNGLSALNTNYGMDSTKNRNVRTHSLRKGVNSGALSTGDVREAYDLFADKDQVEVDFLISPSKSSRSDHTTVVNDLVAKAVARKDCVVVASPARTDIVGVTADADKVTHAVTTANTFTRSSYLIMDNNFLKVYDKFNDIYVNIPAASTVAGIMASTDINRAAWFSPAGSRRGQLLGVTGLSYSPTKAQRDTLYKAGINPIANIPGQGSLLFGDKTMIGRVSAFDRINVRRLFLILERAIGRAAEQVLFEFNDEFTRAEFVNIVEPVLREVQGRRGITDFRVVCDETNNTAAVIDRNEFKADIFIKPARSINFVTLSFVAVRTGVDFEEVVGTV